MVQNSFFQNEGVSSGSSSTATAPIVQPAPAQGGLFDRAVLLSITISALGTKRKVLNSQVEVDADKDFIHVSKDILKSDILVNIKKFDGQSRLWIAERSLPSLFRFGVYLWPIGLVLEADEYLRNREALRAPMIDRLCDAYVALKADAQNRLQALYNPREYPSVEEVRASFAMSYQFIECGVPGRLRDISTEMFERERLKAESVWTNALDEAKSLMRSQFVELVDHMDDRLRPDEDGNPKRFKNSLVTNFMEFLRLFECRNLANDDELQALVNRCREVLGGATSQLIRDDATMRARVAGGMASIREQLSGMVIDGGRRINMESSDDEPGDRFGDI